jgi:flagellar basal body-associated protein FliL
MEKENITTEEPTVSDSEMKMPEEHFGTTANADKNTTHLGIILGILIVLLVLILGGLYLWGTTLQNVSEVQVAPDVERPSAEENNEPESTTADAQVQALETVSTSNEIDAIEADIESTNLDELDAELEAIDAEMEASAESQ